MCGEFEEEDYLDETMFRRFLALARSFGVRPADGNKKSDMDLSQDEDRTQYMKELFSAGLVRSVNDAQFIPQDGERMNAVAVQSIVFARLAGYLAGQLPGEANMTKATMEAMLDGFSEAQDAAKAWDEHEGGHHHHHGHHHHGHSHGHGH